MYMKCNINNPLGAEEESKTSSESESPSESTESLQQEPA